MSQVIQVTQMTCISVKLHLGPGAKKSNASKLALASADLWITVLHSQLIAKLLVGHA